MPKVFVVNQSGHDTSSAKEFGDMHILTEGKINIFATDRVISNIKEKLVNMTIEDYLLFSGYSMLNAIAFAFVLLKNDLVKTLIYNFNTKTYIVREMTLTQFLYKGE